MGSTSVVSEEERWDPWLSLIWRCLLKTQILECENLKHNCLRSSGNVEEICVRVGMLGRLVFFFISIFPSPVSNILFFITSAVS